ncbi:MAG: 5'/3'-nucleotidase SurE [Chloroflexi bacterium]|nr:5'/3'-nucleotidase SurE [Chloroflexota bacterium]
MRILVTNDDGINSRGILALAESLNSVGEVTVVAPAREQSGASGAITLHSPVRITEATPNASRLRAYAVEGTPSDSVILGLERLLEKPIDLVVSGVNVGPNLGSDLFLSGTVAAALQAHFRSITAFAVSVTARKADTTHKVIHLEGAALLARLLARHARKGRLLRGTFLNINVPNLPLEEIEGIEITRTAHCTHVDVVQEGHDGKPNYFWIARRKRDDRVPEPGTDYWAIGRKRISITPLHADWTFSETRSALGSLVPLLMEGLHSPR